MGSRPYSPPGVKCFRPHVRGRTGFMPASRRKGIARTPTPQGLQPRCKQCIPEPSSLIGGQDKSPAHLRPCRPGAVPINQSSLASPERRFKSLIMARRWSLTTSAALSAAPWALHRNHRQISAAQPSFTAKPSALGGFIHARSLCRVCRILPRRG